MLIALVIRMILTGCFCIHSGLDQKIFTTSANWASLFSGYKKSKFRFRTMPFVFPDMSTIPLLLGFKKSCLVSLLTI